MIRVALQLGIQFLRQGAQGEGDGGHADQAAHGHPAGEVDACRVVWGGVHCGGIIPGMQSSLSKTTWRVQAALWWQELSVFPWRQMAGVLAERFRDARLGVSASSLTFTTVLALVPLFAVGLAVFAAFPLFGKFQDTIQRWLIESLVPESKMLLRVPPERLYGLVEE